MRLVARRWREQPPEPAAAPPPPPRVRFGDPVPITDVFGNPIDPEEVAAVRRRHGQLPDRALINLSLDDV
jgi:hypothetical protein